MMLACNTHHTPNQCPHPFAHHMRRMWTAKCVVTRVIVFLYLCLGISPNCAQAFALRFIHNTHIANGTHLVVASSLAEEILTQYLFYCTNCFFPFPFFCFCFYSVLCFSFILIFPLISFEYTQEHFNRTQCKENGMIFPNPFIQQSNT